MSKNLDTNKNLPDNYKQCIAWIESELTRETRSILLPGVRISDVNHSLRINLLRILNNHGAERRAAFLRTKRIKDYLNKNK
jgi:hypothetical protein